MKIPAGILLLTLAICDADPGAFLAKYCFECHDGWEQKGDLDLEKPGTDIAGGDRQATWRLVGEQVQFGDMPPDDEPQPDRKERADFLKWLQDGLLKAQLIGKGKSAFPEFGNEVRHELLFGKEPGPVIPGPVRLWRIRGEIYENLMGGVSDGYAFSQRRSGRETSGDQGRCTLRGLPETAWEGGQPGGCPRGGDAAIRPRPPPSSHFGRTGSLDRILGGFET